MNYTIQNNSLFVATGAIKTKARKTDIRKEVEKLFKDCSDEERAVIADEKNEKE